MEKKERYIPSITEKRELPEGYANSIVDAHGNIQGNQYNYDERIDDDEETQDQKTAGVEVLEEMPSWEKHLEDMHREQPNNNIDQENTEVNAYPAEYLENLSELIGGMEDVSRRTLATSILGRVNLDKSKNNATVSKVDMKVIDKAMEYCRDGWSDKRLRSALINWGAEEKDTIDDPQDKKEFLDILSTVYSSADTAQTAIYGKELGEDDKVIELCQLVNEKYLNEGERILNV